LPGDLEAASQQQLGRDLPEGWIIIDDQDRDGHKPI
jgi:hypothetical protein